MRNTHLSFLWHMHQPDYVDPTSGRALLPWVRLHAARAYYDVAALLDEHPHVRLTVNFVPSLVRQLEQVAAGAVEDAWQGVAARPEWDPADRAFLLQRFFSVHWGRCVETRPRYRELLEKRGRHIPPAALAETLAARAAEFTTDELRDLTVLFTLAWIGFAARKDAPEVEALEKKARGFDAADLQLLHDLQRRTTQRVLPLYSQLAARGQIELSSSPLCHPIVPLLVDTDHAHRALPQATLPPRFAYPEDGAAQIAAAVERHRATFGQPPIGMWPPEGSVSPEAVALYRQAGVMWLATDEGNLWRSARADGVALQHGDLYRAHAYDGVELVFRDRELSDRIGFTYSGLDASTAVDDLIGRARAAGVSSTAAADRLAIVAVILDGENPWESYPGKGEPFLRRLFTRLAEEEAHGLSTASIGGHLADAPASSTLERLHSGSWIDSDFHIWIADPVKNRAWALLGEARRAWRDARAVDEAAKQRALDSLWSAEGSDWFWWFGEPFHSSEDALFDGLFRAHLSGVYGALGLAPPVALSRSVDTAAAPNDLTPPWALISPPVHADGHTSYYAWQGAGSYTVPRGAVMARAPRTETVWLGFDRARLYVRLDPHPTQGPFPSKSRVELEIKTESGAVRVRGQRGSWEAFDDSNGQLIGTGAPVPAGRTLQIAVPFDVLRLRAGQRFELVVRLACSDGDLADERYPLDGSFLVTVPDDQFAREHWSA